jgi:hypothetical protein
MDADGDFVVAWASFGPDGSDWGIFAQRYDAAGVAQGGEFQVNAFTTGDQELPAVAMDADGDFVVAWRSYGQDGSGYGVFAQRYDAAGVGQGGELLVNTQTSNAQNDPAIAMDADGDFVVAWASEIQDGSSDGIFAQRNQGDGPVAGDFTVDGRSDILWRNTGTGNAILWQMDGFAKEAAGSIGAPSTAWQVRGLADFNADTKTDLLWRNTSTGEAVIWLMDGFTKLAAGGIGAPSLDWQVVGTGDFDGDDHADILWRNITSGVTLIWKMDGLSKTASGGFGGVAQHEHRGHGDLAHGRFLEACLWRARRAGFGLGGRGHRRVQQRWPLRHPVAQYEHRQHHHLENERVDQGSRGLDRRAASGVARGRRGRWRRRPAVRHHLAQHEQRQHRRLADGRLHQGCRGWDRQRTVGQGGAIAGPARRDPCSLPSGWKAWNTRAKVPVQATSWRPPANLHADLAEPKRNGRPANSNRFGTP